MFSKILVALDDSDITKKVVEEAIALAKKTDAYLMFLHVLSPFEAGYPEFPVYPGIDGIYPTMYSEAVKSQLEHWQEYEQRGVEMLRGITDQAIACGVKADFTQNLGTPGSTICTLARSWEADLIMMGRRGRTGISEFVLGSVSNYVTHHAPCSVLIVQGAKAIPEVTKEKEAIA